ncbi:MAG: HesA/MoeB/ThiF family protein, partial [Pseudomonadota bacterium]
IVGAGGIGAPVSLYLAQAGVGSITMIDHDTVDLSNLQRQIIYTEQHVGRAKIHSTGEELCARNMALQFHGVRAKLQKQNARSLLEGHALVIDGCDNFATRLHINMACQILGIPLISGALTRFDGQVAIFEAGGPCYKCLYPTMPDPTKIARCDTVGVLGPMAGIVGAMMAAEAIKILADSPGKQYGNLLLFDMLHWQFQKIAIAKVPDCKVCAV